MNSNGNVLWVRNAGGSELNAGQDAVIDHDGNVLISGFFQAAVTFSDTTITGNVSINIFLAKYDSDGNLLWVQQAGGAAGDMATHVDTDQGGNSFITGFFSSLASFNDTSLTAVGNSDVFISKYDPNGNLVWVKQAGEGGGAVGADIVITNTGNINIVGYFSDSLAFAGSIYKSAGLTDIFVAEYDANGNQWWLKTAGGLDGDTGEDIVLYNSDIFISGYFKDEVHFGDFEASSKGSFEAFLAKLGSPVNYIEQQTINPSIFYLMQNYPNPFNPQTIINYELGISSFVELVVFDISGRSVQKLVNGYQNAGAYQVVFDGKGFPSSVYFYRLKTSSGFSQTRKMILLK